MSKISNFLTSPCENYIQTSKFRIHLIAILCAAADKTTVSDRHQIRVRVRVSNRVRVAARFGSLSTAADSRVLIKKKDNKKVHRRLLRFSDIFIQAQRYRRELEILPLILQSPTAISESGRSPFLHLKSP